MTKPKPRSIGSGCNVFLDEVTIQDPEEQDHFVKLTVEEAMSLRDTLNRYLPYYDDEWNKEHAGSQKK